jgi:hypothetical protein
VDFIYVSMYKFKMLIINLFLILAIPTKMLLEELIEICLDQFPEDYWDGY